VAVIENGLAVASEEIDRQSLEIRPSRRIEYLASDLLGNRVRKAIDLASGIGVS